MPQTFRFPCSIGAIVLLCLALSSCASAPKQDRTSVDFQYISGEFMVVPVKVNGALTKNFVIDTGMGITLISKSVCAAIKCVPTGTDSSRRMSGQNIQFSMAKVKSLVLGNHQAKDILVGVCDMEKLMPGQDLGGFLSLNFFKNWPVTFDYPEKRIIFETPQSLSQIKDKGTRVDVRLDTENKPGHLSAFIPLELPGGTLIQAEIDTGNQSLILDERFMKVLDIKKKSKGVKKRTGKDETGHFYTRYFTQIPASIHVPKLPEIGMTFAPVVFQKIIYDGLIGHYFLSQYQVTFAMEDSEMIFTKSPSVGEGPGKLWKK